MKKRIALILIFVLTLNLCPINGVTDILGLYRDVNAASPKDKPVVFYMADDYEEQIIGDYANGFVDYVEGSKGLVLGAVVPKGDNHENIAAEYTSEATGRELDNLLPFYYAPLVYDFVFDFNFNTGTADKISIGISKDLPGVASKQLENAPIVGKVIELSNKVVVNNVVVKENLTRGEWHRFQMKVNMKTKSADIYVDGAVVGRGISLPMNDNLASFRFLSPMPNADGPSKYYLDDIYIYLSDKIISDEELASDLAEYERSGLRPNPRYQAGFGSQYYQYVFDMFYNEFVMSPYGRRVWKDNQFYDFPINCVIENDKVLVPLRAFSEMMGATVDYDDGRITVSKDNRTMTVMEGSDVYYIDGKPSLLHQHVKMHRGYAMLDIDVLCHFFGIKYDRFENMRPTGVESYDLISFSGDFDCDYKIFGDLDAESWSGCGRTMYYECLIRMNEMLYIDIPSRGELRELLDEKYKDVPHPRLIITDFQKLKDDLNRGDAGYNKKVAKFISSADAVLNTDTFNSTYWQGEAIHDFMVSVAFAWNMTGDTKYLDAMARKIDELYIYIGEPYQEDRKNKRVTPLWVGNGTIGLGIAYDWMYNTLKESDPERLEKLHKIIEVMGIEFHDEAFRRPAQSFYTGCEYGYANQTLFKSAGAITACAAIYEYNPELCAGLLSGGIRSISNPFAEFAPDGDWGEGVPYWTYVCGKLAAIVEIFETGFGTHFGLYDIPGVSNTSQFGMSYVGSTGSAYANGDGDAKMASLAIIAKEAKYNNDISKLVQYRASNPAITVTEITNWWFISDEELAKYGDVTVEYDSYMPKLENVLLKTGPDTSDTSVAIHGGGVNDAHGHEDNGTIQFDMIGYRWANEVGREHYNVTGFGDYWGRSKDPKRKYSGWKSSEYYRDGAEGHNTVFADLAGPYTGRFHMDPNAKSTFVKTEFSDTLSFALLDMTSTNPIYEAALRGVKLDKIQNEIIIHDHFQAKEATDFHWGLHTEADVELAEDGRSAVLSTDNGAKRIWIGIISDDDYVIQVLPARPYEGIMNAADIAPGEFIRPAGYENVMLRPPFESPVDAPFVAFESASGVEKGFKRLTIENEKDTKDFNLMVAIKPLTDGSDVPLIMPVAQAMENWSIKDGGKAANVDEILINGKSLDKLKKGVYSYSYEVLTNEDPVPVVEVKVDPKYTAEVISATKLPGLTTIVVREGERVVAIYYINFVVLNDLEKFFSDKQIPVYAYETEGTNPSNTTTFLFDNDPATIFATDTPGYVLLDFGSVKEIEKVLMSFNNGTKRREKIKIEYSTDKENWKLCFEGMASGTTTEYQTFSLSQPDNARYIRVWFDGSDQGIWGSASEIWAFSK